MEPSRRLARTSEAATNDQLVQSLLQLAQITQTLSNALLNNSHPPQNGNRDVVRQIFEVVVCLEDRQVELATVYLRQEADLWWMLERPACRQNPGFSWEILKDKLRELFYPAHVKAENYEEFLHLKQVPLSVMEYHKKFLELARFASVLVPTEESKVEKFVAGLNFEARKAMTVSKPKTLNEAYLCAADLYRVQQVQKGIRESRKRSFETSVAPVVSFRLKRGKVAQPERKRDKKTSKD
ncbi:PREDICTED: uncharacterized protein LOC109154201 [Ipomoea nil]|uniref:uncharacterized protein LOC109154201 n=1 Tax=Ipomoea nil TaxID=35883 RepID=UPI000901C934|nr:PREDICTED: uncharacterized protein LOC109154201 [Ipomoea nil]